MIKQRFRDGRYLLRRFALAEDNLRESGAYCAVVINLGEVQVFVRQASEPGDDIVFGYPSVPVLLQKGA